MSHRFFERICSLLPAAALLTLSAQVPAAGQQPAPKAGQPAANAPARFTVPRTAWGDPDLQGVYTFATLTPFQRPAA